MKEHSLPIVRRHSCQLLVVGGGPAGIASAVMAARSGIRVILAEAEGFLGGVASSCLVGPYMSCYDPKGEIQVIRGFFDELVSRLVREGGAIHPSEIRDGDSHCCYRTLGHAGCTPYDAEVLKRVAEDMCLEAGVTLMYHMSLVDTVMDGSRIAEAIFATKGGLHSIEAEQFLDCTGDADLTWLAGFPTQVGDENGTTQVTSMFFMVSGIDKDRLDGFYKEPLESEDYNRRYMVDFLQEEHRNGRFPCGRSEVNISQAMNGLWFVNLSQIDRAVDISDPEQVTAAEIEGRRQIPVLIDFMHRNIPGCENAVLVKSSSRLGVRESRHIIGEYQLTGEDVLNGRIFADGVLTAGNGIDSHNQKDNDYQVAEKPYTVPYRCFIPQGSENLLAAGRCLSADHAALAAVRVSPPCYAMGHAVGRAMGLAIRYGIRPSDIDITELREILVQDGAYLL
ncbi:MAG: FAD-dependent oxidoreductase [Lachnospiraceae bacterium]|nr:FAD-dependent oxidoreductase [Lachnospiraceae bacterium]